MILESRQGQEEASEADVPLAEYSPVVARLDRLIDSMAANTSATIAAAGAKPPKITPQPRPKTAVDYARHRKQSREYKRIVDRFRPSDVNE